MNNARNMKKTGNAILNSKIFWIVVSVLIAFFLWLYVTSTEGVETEKTFNGVKVEFIGADTLRESSGLIVTEQDCTTVNLVLSGTRRVLSKLTSSNITAAVDLSNVFADARYSVSYSLRYPSSVSESEVTVVRSSTDVINFYVDKLTSKTVNVEGKFTGNTAAGYLAADTISFEPMTVKISGPKTAINQVEKAFVTITREDVDKTLQFATSYELLDKDGNVVDDDAITRETPEVNATLTVLSTKTVPLDVTIVDGGGATRQDLELDIQPGTITLAGDAETIDSTTKILLGTIDLSDFTTDFEQTYTIVPPNDTEIISGDTSATVKLTVKGLATKTFVISQDNISCINVAEGYTADVITKSLTITVRAAQDVLDQIQENNLMAVADLTGASASSGVLNPAVKIYINGFPTAGVIGDYKIHVTLNAS